MDASTVYVNQVFTAIHVTRGYVSSGLQKCCDRKSVGSYPPLSSRSRSSVFANSPLAATAGLYGGVVRITRVCFNWLPSAFSTSKAALPGRGFCLSRSAAPLCLEQSLAPKRRSTHVCGTEPSQSPSRIRSGSNNPSAPAPPPQRPKSNGAETESVQF